MIKKRGERIPLALRFWSKVLIGPKDKCWTWEASCRDSKHGHTYGEFRWNTARMIVAHRAAWMIERGPIPDNLNVLHRCDNPPCVNPSHLFLGTQRENMADCKRKGRTQRYNSKKTHCKYGHPFSGSNLRINIYGHRVCKACDREAHKGK